MKVQNNLFQVAQTQTTNGVDGTLRMVHFGCNTVCS